MADPTYTTVRISSYRCLKIQRAPNALYDIIHLGKDDVFSHYHIRKKIEENFPHARNAYWMASEVGPSDLRHDGLAVQADELLETIGRQTQDEAANRRKSTLFVCWGTRGGVLLKTALLKLTEHVNTDNSLYDRICGVFFLGCLHDERRGNFDTRVVRTLMTEFYYRLKPDIDAWTQWEPAANLVVLITSQFRKLKLPFPVWTYYESVATIYAVEHKILKRDIEHSEVLCPTEHTGLQASPFRSKTLPLLHNAVCGIDVSETYLEMFLKDLRTMTDTLEKKVMTSSRVSGGLPGERTLKNSQATGSTSTNFIALPPKLESNTKDSVSNSNRKVYQEETAISDKPGAENEGKAVQPHHAPMLGLVAEGRTDRISDSDHKSIPEGATPTEFVVNYNHLYSGADDRISKHANVVQAKTSSRKYNTSASFQNQLSTPAIMDYKVGWICALPFETAAAEVMLDEQYSDLPLDPYSSVLYTLGRIGPHNVVIACLPRGRPGLAAASVVASEMRQRFRGIRFGFMVGIGGGVPNARDDIRLGDVVVSKPNFEHGGVTQYDFGKAEEGGIFRRTGHLNNPPTLLLSVLSRVETNHERGRRIYPIHMTRYLKEDMEEYLFPQNERDTLFSADYSHPTGTLDCTTCDPDQVIIRPDRNTKNTTVKIHYGTIASGNQVIKDAQTRDRIVRDLGGQVLCFEMEAAGLMNDFPCLVVRGISDYCDSHKNDGWQRYAAANAAAYTRELLLLIPSEDVVE